MDAHVDKPENGVSSYSYPPTYKISPQVTWTPVTEHGAALTPPLGSPRVEHTLPPPTQFNPNAQLPPTTFNAASVEASLAPQVNKSILMDSALPSSNRPQVNHTLLMDSALTSFNRPQVNHTLLMDSVLPSDDSHVDTSLLIDSALPTNQPPTAGTTLLLEAMRELEE
jgi:hypothetical protein